MSVGRSQLAIAIEALRSLHDGDRGVAAAAACGDEAIPLLRDLLFQREPSGLFETRRRAVEALASLRAYDVLIEFLESRADVADPVERVGEDAVINSAALALRSGRDPRVFRLLASLAERRRSLSGVVAALGEFRAVEAIPYLVDALAEDESRAQAEAALRNIGPPARDALVSAARCDPATGGRESESRLRQRRSALALLVEMGVPPDVWSRLRETMDDQDPRLRLLACQLCLGAAPQSEREAAVRRLNHLRFKVDSFLRMDIERCLADYAEKARET